MSLYLAGEESCAAVAGGNRSSTDGRTDGGLDLGVTGPRATDVSDLLPQLRDRATYALPAAHLAEQVLAYAGCRDTQFPRNLRFRHLVQEVHPDDLVLPSGQDFINERVDDGKRPKYPLGSFLTSLNVIL